MKTQIALVLILAALPTVARAEDKPTQPKSYVNALVGDEIFTSVSGSVFAYSARLGTTLVENPSGLHGVGFFINSFGNSATVSGVTADARVTYLMAELLTRRAWGTGLYFGGRAGIAITSFNFSSGSTNVGASATSFAFAPVAGYEVDVAPQVALNLDLAWLNRMGATLNFPGVGSLVMENAAAVAIQGGVMFRF